MEVDGEVFFMSVYVQVCREGGISLANNSMMHSCTALTLALLVWKKSGAHACVLPLLSVNHPVRCEPSSSGVCRCNMQVAP